MRHCAYFINNLYCLTIWRECIDTSYGNVPQDFKQKLFKYVDGANDSNQ